MSQNPRITRERNAVDYTGIGHAATPGWLKGNLARSKSTLIKPLAIQYDVQAPVPDKGAKRRHSPNEKAPDLAGKSRSHTALTTLSAAVGAASAKATSKDVSNSDKADRPATSQKEDAQLKANSLQPRADANRRGKSAPEPPQLLQNVPAAALSSRRRGNSEATPVAPLSAPAPKAATVPVVNKKRKEAAGADKATAAAAAAAAVELAAATTATATAAADKLVNKRRKTTGSSEALPAAVSAPVSGTRPVKVTAAAALAQKQPAAAPVLQQECAVMEDIAPAQRSSRHRGVSAGHANAAALPAAKGLNTTAGGSVRAEVTPPMPAANQNATQQVTLAVSKDAPHGESGKQRQKASTQKGAAGPSTQIDQQLARNALPQEAPSKSVTVAPMLVLQASKGHDQSQAPPQQPLVASTANNLPGTVVAIAAAATAAAATAAAATAAAATAAVLSGAQQRASAVTNPAAPVPSHVAIQAPPAVTRAGAGLDLATTSAAGPSQSAGGAVAARCEGRAFLTLQGQYKELQEQYIALKAQKVVELEELVAGHDVHVEEMTGAAKRLADLWHKQTLAQMALVQAGTSQDVATRLQQLQSEVLALKEAGADCELRLLQQSHNNMQLQAQLQEVRTALAAALQPKEVVAVPAVQEEAPVGHCSISLQFPSPGPNLPSGPTLSPAPQRVRANAETAAPHPTHSNGTLPSPPPAIAAGPDTTPAVAAAAATDQQSPLVDGGPTGDLEAGTPAALRALLVATQLQSSAITRLAPPHLNLLPSSASSAANVSNPGWGQTSNQTGTPLTQQSLGLQRTLHEMQAAVANIFVNPSAFCAQQQSDDAPSVASTPSFGLNRVIADMQLAVSNAAAVVHAVVGTPESEIAARDLDSPVEGWRQGAATGSPLLQQQQQLLSPGHTAAATSGLPNSAAGPAGGFTTSATFVELNPQESARKAALSAADRQAAFELANVSGSSKLLTAVLPPLTSQDAAQVILHSQNAAQVIVQNQLAAAAALPLPQSPANTTQRRLHLGEDAMIHTHVTLPLSPVKLSTTQLGQMGAAAPTSPTAAGVTTTTTAHHSSQLPPPTAALIPQTGLSPSMKAVPAMTGPLCTRTPPRKSVVDLATAAAPAVQELAQLRGSVVGAHAAGSPILSNQDSCSGPQEGNPHGGVGLLAAAGTLSAIDNNIVGSRTPTASKPGAQNQQVLFPGAVAPGSAPRTAPRPPLAPGSAKRPHTPGAMTPGTAAINAGLHKLLGWTCKPVPLKPHTFRWTHSATAFSFEIGPALMDEDPEELQEVFQAFDGELQEGQSQGGAAAGQWLEYTLIACGTARLEPFLQDSFQFPESSSAVLMGGLLTVDRA